MEQNMMKELISISILEKDSNEDLLLVWYFYFINYLILN